MRPSYESSARPVDSVIINDISSQKSTVTLLHSPSTKPHHHHHLYNYWTYNERLRSKNEKLIKRQQSSCRIAFYSLWLFIFAGVMAIIVYRFTEDCSIMATAEDRRQTIMRCFRYILLFTSICISVLACTGLFYGACRYFRSQPETLVFGDQQHMNQTDNYDVLPINHRVPSCCSQVESSTGTSNLVTHIISSPAETRSNARTTSSIQSHRKIPPFTYEEFPTRQSTSPIQTLSISSCTNGNLNSSMSHPNKIFFFSTSTSSSSSPQSMFSRTTNSEIAYSDPKSRKSAFASEVVNRTTPTSYMTCLCPTDVWERQTKSSIS